MIFTLAVSSLNNLNYVIHYKNQPTIVEENFTNIVAIYKTWGIITNLTMKSMGIYYLYVKHHNAGIWSMDKKHIVFFVQKHIAHRTVCYNFPLVHDKPLGAPTFVKLIY